MMRMFNPIRGTPFIEISSNNYLFLRHIISCQTMADVKYGVTQILTAVLVLPRVVTCYLKLCTYARW